MKLKVLVFGLLIFCFACGQEKEAKQVEKEPAKLALQPGEQKAFTLQSNNLDYLLYLPSDYLQKEKHPLLLFMHGAGERGDSIELVKKWGPPKKVDQGEKLPFIIASPQCPVEKYWPQPDQMERVITLMDSLQANYNIDANRIYVTGLSMGGFGTWKLAALLNDKIAAAAPICGGGDQADAKAISNVPIWAFHGALDDVVPLEESVTMQRAVKAKGGQVKLTVYPSINHDSWVPAYANEELYTWLLSHSLAD